MTVSQKESFAQTARDAQAQIFRLFWPTVIDQSIEEVAITGLPAELQASARVELKELLGTTIDPMMISKVSEKIKSYLEKQGLNPAQVSYDLPVDIPANGRLHITFKSFQKPAGQVFISGTPETVAQEQKKTAKPVIRQVTISTTEFPEELSKDVKLRLEGAPLTVKSMTDSLQFIADYYHKKGIKQPKLKFNMNEISSGILALHVEDAPTLKEIETATQLASKSPIRPNKPKKTVRPAPERLRGILLKDAPTQTQPNILVTQKIKPKPQPKPSVPIKDIEQNIIENLSETLTSREVPLEQVSDTEVLTDLAPVPTPGVAPPDETNISEEGEPTPAGSEITVLTSLGGDPIEPQPFDEQDFLFLEGAIHDTVVAEIIEAYYVDGKLFLPLSVLAESLQFRLQVDPGTGRAEGWFSKQENSLSLRVQPTPRLTIRGKDVPLDASDVRADGMDIYVASEVLASWFDIGLELNLADLMLHIEPNEDIPLQAKLSRRSLWQKYKRSSINSQQNQDISITEVPYQAFGKPAIRLTSTNTFTQDTDGGRAANNNLSIQTQGDLAFMSGRTNINVDRTSGERPKIRDVTVTLERKTLQPTLLGPLKATEVEIGDINLESLPLVPGSKAGRGINITNEPAGYVRDPENFEITGDGPVGWDVEVYQGDRLLDFQVIGSDGKYSFDALPLSTGLNLFKTVLYGPNGEKQEKFDKFFLGQGLLDKNQFVYNMGYLQSTDAFIPVDENRTLSPNENILSARAEYGLRKNLSLLGGVYHGVSSDIDIDAMSLGLRGTAGNLYFQGDTAQMNEGEAYSVLGRYALARTSSISAGYSRFRGLPRELRSETDNTFVRYDTQFTGIFDSPLRFSLEGREQRFLQNPTEKSLVNRLSSRVFGMAMSNDLTYTSVDNASPEDLNGTLTARGRLKDYDIRARGNYTLKDERKLESITIDTQRKLSKELTLDAGLERDFTGRTENRYTAGLNWKLPQFEVGVTAEHGSLGDSRVLARVATTLAPTRDGYKKTSNSSSFSEGSLWVKSFLDKNENNIQDEGEENLEGVTIRSRLRGSKATTDESGLATVGRIATFIPNKVEVLTNTLPDIYMQPSIPDMHVLGRPGVIGPIEFPIQQLGEINGTMSLMQNGELALLSEQPLLLFDEEDNPITHTYTAYDGFYFFPSLPMGTYKVVIPTDTLAQYGVEHIEPLSITLTPDNTVINDLDVVLQESVQTFE